MAPGRESAESTTLTPNEAFALLGNETRVDIIQALGEADGPMAFSELRDRIGIRQGAQFNYHLDKLVGHFVEKTDAGYKLKQSGRRIVMAVLSGAVTDDPHVDATVTALPCSLCGEPTEITYHEEHVRLFCTDCPGHYGEDPRNVGSMDPVMSGYLGSLPIPPAAVRDRSPEELALAAATWGHAYQLVMSSGVCPDCGSTVDRSVSICHEHEASDTLCDSCNGYHPTRVRMECTHCIAEWEGRFDNGLLSTTELQLFLLEHGANLLAPTTNIWSLVDYSEEVLSVDPFEGRYIFTIDDDTLTLIVDDELTVIDAIRG